MTSLPIPFVVAMLIAILAISNHKQLKETPSGKAFATVLYVNALSMVLIGLRWSQDMVTLLPFVAVLSVVGSALLYLAFYSLGRQGPVAIVSRDWVHLVSVVVVALVSFLLFQWTDIVVIAAKLLYAGLLLQLARKAPDSLQLVRLSWLKNTQQALWAATSLLLFSVVLDIAITIDFMLYEGRHSADLVGMVSLLILLLLAWISVLAGRGRADDEVSDSTTNVAQVDASDSGDKALLDQLNNLLVDQQLFADTELNLQRLARKAGIPARNISRVVNAHTGQNVSQWVNRARIDAVCTLLQDNKITVSEAMLKAGFLTKSNFNREFRRLKGCSPSEWRDPN